MSYGMDGWCRREESTMGQVGIEGQSTKDSIGRQEVLDAIDEIEKEVADGEGFQYEKWRKYFCDLPSTQPKPRTGKWLIRKFGDDGKCSVCGMYCGEYDLEGSDRYCRCCGAKMEGLEVSE